MLGIEQSMQLLESLLDLSLPVKILSVIYALIMLTSIVRVHILAFEFRSVLGFVLLMLSPLLLFIFVGMALLYSHLEVKELLRFMVVHQDPISIGLALMIGGWFIIAWLNARLFWQPLTRMFSLSVLYFIALMLLKQFPLFS